MTRNVLPFASRIAGPLVILLAFTTPRALGQRALGQRANGQIVQYVCPNCQKVVPHEVGVPPPKQCPHCQTKFDGIQTSDGQVVRRFEHPLLSNVQILGVLCSLFVLAAGTGAVVLIVKLTGKKKKRVRRRPVRDFDEDDDDDDRPRRRRRDSR